MGDNLPPGVSPNDPDAPWNEPPATVCDTCEARMHSPADHKDDCPDAPWNDRCTCDVTSRNPNDHATTCAFYKDELVCCVVCRPPPGDSHDPDDPPLCDQHSIGDYVAKLERDAGRRREDRLQEDYEADHDGSD
jgi:hypothetical protein